MNAIEIITAWNALTPEQQINFCKACVCKAIKSGRTLKAGYDMQDATQETYCKVLKRLANVDKLEADCKRRADNGKPNTLAAVVCRAANATMENIAYHHRKDSKTTSTEITTADDETLDLLDTVAATDDTEQTAIIRAELKRFVSGLGDTNKIIFAGMVDGLTERELAPTVGISNVAVHNRIVKLRAALAALL